VEGGREKEKSRYHWTLLRSILLPGVDSKAWERRGMRTLKGRRKKMQGQKRKAVSVRPERSYRGNGLGIQGYVLPSREKEEGGRRARKGR